MSKEDNSWVFDSLVAFLNGPIWNAPLQSFIEEKSLIFEPSVTENDEYRKIFDEFKNLVDFMLSNFMEDIGISSEQFQAACAEGKRYHVSFDNNLFEQIWAANDFPMFVRMMTQRNVELQLQALELIERKYGITPQSFVPQKEGETNKTDEEKKLEKTVSVSVERESKLEKEILEEAAKRFTEDESSEQKSELKNLMEQKPILERTLKATLEAGKPFKENDAKKDEIKAAKQETGSDIDVKKVQEVDGLELKKRQEYLRAQRDKLVALKKEARQKQLTSEAVNKSKNRPKSAKAAEAALTGEKGTVNESQLQIRKALAERLKAEVVDKKSK